MEEIVKMDELQMARGYNGPVLLIHGTEDALVPVDCVYKYQTVYGDQMKLLLVEGSNHQFSSLKWKQEVYDESVAFIKEQIAR